MANDIVTVNVSRTLAPAPSTLQRTGAFVSQGGTNLAPGTTSLLTQELDLTPLTPAAIVISTMTWATGTVTVNTATPHGIPVGKTVQGVIAGVTPTGYNGTFACTGVDADTFTFPLVSNPGSVTVEGTFQPYAVSELQQMANTFFAQGAAVSVLVLELGLEADVDGIAALNTYLTANPNTIYSFLIPRAWASQATYVAMVNDYTSNTAKTYFYTTMTLANYGSFVTNKSKSVVGMVEAPAIPATEFPLAALFYSVLNNNPSNTNKVAPTAFRFLTAVTAYPTLGNGPTLAALKTANVNYVGTGAEGGISNTIVKWGTTLDGRDVSYWYSIDWVQINLQLDLANEIINGSNNPINPLYYNQDGVNRLQSRAQATMDRGITYGLVLPGTGTVNAVPFRQYVTDNPSDYPIGKYAGLSTTYTPQLGFKEIIFNVNVSDFITQ